MGSRVIPSTVDTMSARRFDFLLTGYSCGGRDMVLRVRPADVKLRSCGMEFSSPWPLPLWIELEIELRDGRAGPSRRHQGVIVACEAAGCGRSRISLLFTGSPKSARTRRETRVPADS